MANSSSKQIYQNGHNWTIVKLFFERTFFVYSLVTIPYFGCKLKLKRDIIFSCEYITANVHGEKLKTLYKAPRNTHREQS